MPQTVENYMPFATVESDAYFLRTQLLSRQPCTLNHYRLGVEQGVGGAGGSEAPLAFPTGDVRQIDNVHHGARQVLGAAKVKCSHSQEHRIPIPL